ncbi:MAG TPA: hypothetical protein VLK65_27560 [Vicinamibacteria bacterium]|nr:hypothetical protein [Vicinamibacteria bacterium]
MSVKKDTQGQPVDSARDYAERIHALIEADRVLQARALVSEAVQENPHDGGLLALAEVLKPPRAQPRQIKDTDRSQEFEWILANREAYRGRWVAIQGDELVADAASFGELQSRIKSLEKAPLVHRIH